ncbi:hypothetical protein GOV07_00180 [Candidatus Woesearchaeota archaeon]|nr:hypothetical protein [Candidatus Woesearchaeota archaeon]
MTGRILTLYDSMNEESMGERVVFVGFTNFDYNKEFQPLIDEFKKGWSRLHPAEKVSYERDFFSPKSHGARMDPTYVEKTADNEGNVNYTSPIVRVSAGEPPIEGGEAMLELMYSNIPKPILQWLKHYRLYGDAVRVDNSMAAYENPRDYPVGIVTAWNHDASVQLIRALIRRGILEESEMRSARSNRFRPFLKDVNLEEILKLPKLSEVA